MINQPKLNLACGQIRIEGFFGIDLVKTKNVDAAMDLQVFPWDIASESAEEVICNHYIEHTPMDTLGRTLLNLIRDSDNFGDLQARVAKIDPNLPSDGLIMFMEELYRIMKMGGIATITTPHYMNSRTWHDPTHRRAISEITYNYFNRKWLEVSDIGHYDIKANFDVKIEGYALYPDVHSKSEEEKKFSMRHLYNFVADMKVRLTKLPLN